MSLMVGSDPEVFLRDVNGNPVPSQDIVPGTKEQPEKMKYGMIHRDNVLLELNPIPAKSQDEFVDNTILLVEEVRELLKPRGLDLLVQPGAEFDELELLHPEAQVFGCEGDIDAWFLDDADVPNPDSAGNYRSAGGHVHLGFPETDSQFKINVARTLDLVVGVPSVIVDQDTRRRELYGQGGRIRIKDYGLEYRVPSNFWLMSVEYMKWIYAQAAFAYANPSVAKEYIKTEKQALELKQIINHSEIDEAQTICTELGIPVPEVA